MCRLYNEFGVRRVERQPLGVDTQTFHPAQARSDWRASLGIAPQQKVLVYAGRFSREKNLPVLVDAVQRLGGQHLLLAIGAGPQAPAGDQVRVLPYLRSRAELATALASADAFVHAGDQETFGLSVLEALACGTPVVARACGGLCELVDASVGLAVDSGHPGAFAQALQAVLSADREPLSKAARLRAERYAWPQVLGSLEARYLRLLRRPGAGIPHLRAVASA